MLVRETALVLSLVTSCWSHLLGAGQGQGSCAARPFRAREVSWTGGCPDWAPCCSEYGYCRPRVSSVRSEMTIIISVVHLDVEVRSEELLHQLSYAIKNKLGHPKALERNIPIGGHFLPYAGSLWHEGAL